MYQVTVISQEGSRFGNRPYFLFETLEEVFKFIQTCLENSILVEVSFVAED